MSMSVEMILRLIDQATGPLRGVSREMDHLKAETEALNRQRAAGGVKASVWLEHQKRLKEATLATGEHRREIVAAEKAAIGWGTGVGLAIGAAGAGAAAYGLHQAISFEKEMADVRKKIDLAPGAQWADVERMINRTATSLGMARGEVAGLTASAGQAGIAYQDLSEFMNLAASAASAWDMAPKAAAQRLAEIKSATQMTIPQLGDFADKVNALGDKSAASERDIVAMFQRSAAASQAAGVPLDTTLAMLTALKSTGMAEEKAATFMNAFVSTLKTAGEGGRGAKAAAEGYKMLGLSVKDVVKGMKFDPSGTIIDLLDRLEKSPEGAKAGVKIFGRQWWDEAAAAGKSLSEMRKDLELLRSGEYKGSLAKNLATDLDTAANHLERFKSLSSEIGDNFMRWALPPINSTIEKAVNALRDYQDKAAAREKSMQNPQGRSVAELEKELRLEKEKAAAPRGLIPAGGFLGTTISGRGGKASYGGGIATGGVERAGWAQGRHSGRRHSGWRGAADIRQPCTKRRHVPGRRDQGRHDADEGGGEGGRRDRRRDQTGLCDTGCGTGEFGPNRDGARACASIEWRAARDRATRSSRRPRRVRARQPQKLRGAQRQSRGVLMPLRRGLKVPKKRVESGLKPGKATVAGGVEVVTIPLKEYEDLLRLRRLYGQPGEPRLLPPPSRSPIEGDREVSDFLNERLGRMLLKDVVAAGVAKFGKERAPSRSAIHRYHKRHMGGQK